MFRPRPLLQTKIFSKDYPRSSPLDPSSKATAHPLSITKSWNRPLDGVKIIRVLTLTWQPELEGHISSLTSGHNKYDSIGYS